MKAIIYYLISDTDYGHKVHLFPSKMWQQRAMIGIITASIGPRVSKHSPPAEMLIHKHLLDGKIEEAWKAWKEHCTKPQDYYYTGEQEIVVIQSESTPDAEGDNGWTLHSYSDMGATQVGNAKGMFRAAHTKAVHDGNGLAEMILMRFIEHLAAIQMDIGKFNESVKPKAQRKQK